MATAKDILNEIKEKDVKYVDVRFTDMRGKMQHVTFDIDLVLKDLRTMLDEGKRLGVTMPVVAETLRIYEDASKAGWGPRDAAFLPAWWPSTQKK